MNNSFELRIRTPHKSFFTDKVIILKIQDTRGIIEILPNHMPLVTIIKPSPAEFIGKDSKKYKAFISDGMMRVHGNTVSIVCRAAEWPEEIDVERAESAKKRAEERLKLKKGIDISRAQNALLRATMRIKSKNTYF